MVDSDRQNSGIQKRGLAAWRAGEAILQQGVRIFGMQPQIGRPIEGLPEEFREWLIDVGDSG